MYICKEVQFNHKMQKIESRIEGGVDVRLAMAETLIWEAVTKNNIKGEKIAIFYTGYEDSDEDVDDIPGCSNYKNSSQRKRETLAYDCARPPKTRTWTKREFLLSFERKCLSKDMTT